MNRILRQLLAVLMLLFPCIVTGDEVAVEFEPEEKFELLKAANMGLNASWETQKDARYFWLKLPAPRGQIVDRFGKPLAQNKVGWYLALQLEGNSGLSDAEILTVARMRMDEANTLLKTKWNLEDQEIIDHFRNRRWVPQRFTNSLTESQRARVERAGIAKDGLVLFPTYQRLYPQNAMAAHIVGYVGKETAVETTELVTGEPLYPMSEGRDGLELVFDDFLRGVPGRKSWLFDSEGRKVFEEQTKAPQQGGHVVTTLDLEMQKLAEQTLSYSCKRGAFVVIDVHSGDILVMASFPSFDLNKFVPAISFDAFQALQDDPNLPLFARSFRGAYPPASTFKAVVAMGAMEAGVVDETTLIDCPAELKVDGRWFKNHSGSAEGKMDVSRALARSCNTWFYDVGLKMGGESLVSMARRFGFGEPTGIPLMAEATGAMPSNGEMLETYGYELRGGYLANAAIGQGHVAATPLQVAQMMAGIANRHHLPKLRLVQQVQDSDGNVIRHFPERKRYVYDLPESYFEAVTQGMKDVVNESYGTGKSGANSYQMVAGKTGTGQWNVKEKKYVGWFAGFVPADEPEFAFAVLYEGAPGQYVSGGKFAAPMARYFFNQYYRYIEPERLQKQERLEQNRIAKMVARERAIEQALMESAPGEEIVRRAIAIEN
jgi:penicillin-binding protein 2